MILQLDDNMLMLLELLPSPMIILLIFLIQRCVWDVIEVSLRCQTCVCCMSFTVFMYAAMYDVWLPVNKCYNVRSGSYLSGLFIPACDTQAYTVQNPADQAQCKWLVLPQCTWGQWNPIPLCNMTIFVTISPFYIITGRVILRLSISSLDTRSTRASRRSLMVQQHYIWRVDTGT